MFWQESILGLIPCLFLSKDNIVRQLNLNVNFQFSLSTRNQRINFVCWFCEDGLETKMAFEIYPPICTTWWMTGPYFLQLSQKLKTDCLMISVFLLKYGSEEKGSWLYRCSILLGFIVSKKQERLRSELLSEDKITNLLGFLT